MTIKFFKTKENANKYIENCKTCTGFSLSKNNDGLWKVENIEF